MYNHNATDKYFYNNNLEYELDSKSKIERINSILKQKEKDLEELKYTIRVFNVERIRVIRDEVNYLWFLPLYFDEIREWLKISKTKYDKRKKYKGKEILEYVEKMISRKFFKDRPIRIYEVLSGGYETHTFILKFICEDMVFQLSIPNFKNISIKNFEYANEGKLEICVFERQYCTMRIVADYDEEVVAKRIESFFSTHNREYIESIKENTKDLIKNT